MNSKIHEVYIQVTKLGVLQYFKVFIVDYLLVKILPLNFGYRFPLERLVLFVSLVLASEHSTTCDKFTHTHLCFCILINLNVLVRI